MEQYQEQATEALGFVQTLHEILPGWVQVGGLVLIGLACIGGAYALWRMFAARRRERAYEHEREEIRLARLAVLAEAGDDQPCPYCALREHAPYWSWSDWLADVRDIGVPIEHILRRCKGAVPPTPVEVLDARIDARVAEERKRLANAPTVKLPLSTTATCGIAGPLVPGPNTGGTAHYAGVYRGGWNPCAPCQRVV